MHREAEVRALQRRQLGLVTTPQCGELGVTRKVVAGRVQAGRWERVLPGVYRDRGHPASLSQLALAAGLWGGPAALVSHATAGALVALDGVAVERPHIWVPPSRTARSALVVVHRGELAAIDRRMIGPIPVTSPARTLIDLAGLLDDEDLAAAVEDAIHRGLTTPMSVSRRLDALGGKGRPGVARLREILDDRGSSAAAESRLEVKIWRTLRSAGMRPVRQHLVRVDGRSYRIDCAFPRRRLGVEGIGDRFHRSPLQRRRDQQRLADLASLSWRIIPVTWHDITTVPQQMVDRVMRALAEAA
jgi:very-short-patch-repair endonuclease